jgi:glycosyltransferase involved in cell wall biosynthesis
MSNPSTKIVVIGPCYPYRGGIATFVSYLCNLLNKHFDVTLINYSMLYPSVLFPGKTQYDESKDLVFSFENKRLFSSLNPFSWVRTANEIKKLNPDIIIMDWWNPFFALCFRGLYIFLPKEYKKKILIVAENVVSHEGRSIDKLLTKIGITIANAYIVLSDKVKEQISYYAGNKTIYKSNLPIYDSFDTVHKVHTRKEVCYKINDGDFVLLFFGYIRKYKGLDIALESMPAILEKIPNAKLLVVGESYDDWAAYETIIHAHDLQNHVEVVSEYVPNEEVEKYFSVSDLVLLPYRNATQSGILNIAYGFDKPVVATSVGGFTEFIEEGKTGLLVKEVSPESFANGVINFYNNYRNVDFKTNIQKIVAANSFDKIIEYVKDFGANIR